MAGIEQKLTQPQPQQRHRDNMLCATSAWFATTHAATAGIAFHVSPSRGSRVFAVCCGAASAYFAHTGLKEWFSVAPPRKG